MKSLYMIYDLKSQFHYPPMVFNTNGEAIRSLADEAKNSQSAIAKHPADYRLSKVGTFDPSTGEIIVITPDVLGTADQFVE